jgi:hypothetical protein
MRSNRFAGEFVDISTAMKVRLLVIAAVAGLGALV